MRFFTKDGRLRRCVEAPWWAPCLLVGLVTAIYVVSAFSNGFVGDDHRFVVENPALREPGAWLRVFWDPSVADPAGFTGIVRPLRTVEFVADLALGGDPWIFHLHSLAWHGVAAVLVFHLLAALLCDRRAALLGAALWAAHPMHVESVAFVSSRGDVAMGACVVGSLLLALRSVGRDRFLAASLGVGLLAMLYKETAVVLPLLVFCVRFARPRNGVPRRVWPALRDAWPWLVVALVYLLYRESIRSAELAHADFVLGGGVAGAFATVPRAFGAYIGFALLPVRPAWDWFMPVSFSFGDASGSAWLVVHGTLVALAVRVRHRAPALSAGLCWFYVALLPVANWPVNLGIPTAERFLYLSLIGFAWMVASVIRRGTVVPAVIAVVAMSVLSADRARDWSDQETMFRVSAVEADSPRGLEFEANAHLARGWRLQSDPAGGTAADARFESALDLSLRAVEVWASFAPPDLPGHPAARSLEIAALANLGLRRFEDAHSLASRAVAAAENSSRAHYARAWTFLETGRPRQAVADMARAGQLGEPLDRVEFVVFYGRAGGDLAATGNTEEARRVYRTALDLRIPCRATDAVRDRLRALAR